MNPDFVLCSGLVDAVAREVAASLWDRARATRRDPSMDVADLVQDVLVALLRSDGRALRRWDPTRGRTLESFVRLVTRRHVTRLFKYRRRNPWSETPIDPTELEVSDDSTEARRVEAWDELDRVLDRLRSVMGVRDHALFELLFVEELQPADVAERMQ